MNTQAAAVDPEAQAFSAKAVRRLFLVMLALLAAGAPVLWVRFGRGMGLSFIVGGLVSLLNFYWLKRILVSLADAVTLAGERRSPAGVIFRFVLRYLLIALVSYAIFKSSGMSLKGLCAGLSLPVGAVLFEAIYALYGGLRRGF